MPPRCWRWWDSSARWLLPDTWKGGHAMSERFNAVLLVIGSLFMLLAAIGVLRLPDIFIRLQAATKASTLGVGCLLLGVAIHFDHLGVATRAVLVIGFFFLTAPVAAH